VALHALVPALVTMMATASHCFYNLVVVRPLGVVEVDLPDAQPIQDLYHTK
jgi:hypothetical protein